MGHGARPGKPMLLAPAMNAAMWEHPLLTQQQLSTTQGFWSGSSAAGALKNCVQVMVAPQVKTLACGEQVGDGDLVSVDAVVGAVKECLK